MPRRRNITTQQVHAEHWDNHEAVVIRSLNTDDEEHINDQIADVDENGKVKLRTGRNKRLTLQRAIVSWTLTDEHGRPVPLNEQSIRELAPEDSQYVFEQVQALNKPMSNDEKKDSTTTVSSSTEKVESPRKQR